MARDYLNELLAPSSSSKHLTTVPNGPHLRVLMWLRDAVNAFRESSIPSLGQELHVNIHESILSASVLPAHDGDDHTGGHPGATRIIAAWWRSTTSPQERNTWAVLDMHHYHAWEPACQGALDGQRRITPVAMLWRGTTPWRGAHRWPPTPFGIPWTRNAVRGQGWHLPSFRPRRTIWCDTRAMM
jgi:hypothetical protein